MVDPTEAHADAARKQKINNLKLRTACLEAEEDIQNLHVSDWTETQKQKLAETHNKAAGLLVAVETETNWSLREMYDLAKLTRVCGLELQERDLQKPDDKANYVDVLTVKKTLQELKQNRNKTRVVSFTGLIDNSLSKVEQVEEEARRSQLDMAGLARIPGGTLRQVEAIMNVTNTQTALSSTEEQIKTILAQIDKTNDIQNIAMSDGEMQIAEEQMYTKVQLQERLIELIHDKYGVTAKVEEENDPFKMIYDEQKEAATASETIREDRRRLKQRCEADLRRIHDAIQKADLEDAEASKRLEGHRTRSDGALQTNLEKQDECWRQIQDLERQLQHLGTERFDEVKRRIDESDQEELRRVEYHQFLEVVAQQKKLLELTLYNCDVAIRCAGLVDEVVAEGCAAVKSRYDCTVRELHTQRLGVHKEYLEFFRMLYLTLGNLIYKKEKKLEELDRNIRTTHIQLEFCIETFDPNAKKHSDAKKQLYMVRAQTEEELAMLKEKQGKAQEDFQPTEEALVAAGIEFVHPADEQNREILDRRSKMVEYRAHLSKQEELKITAEREELKRAKQLRMLRAPSPRHATNPPQIADASGPD